jgi:general secretion pathway protein N
VLADARGTLWSGSAVPVLTGGAGSRDRSALPGRLAWTLAAEGRTLALKLRQPCCIDGTLALRIEPGWTRLRIALPDGSLGQWPAGWLVGLGTPWNTLQLDGWLRFSARGAAVEAAAGRLQIHGRAELALDDIGSRLATVAPLGSYRLTLDGGAPAALRMTTRAGPLLLDGSGTLDGTRLHFRGSARAAEGAEAALANLLNLLGRRQGPRALISIG